MNKVFLSYSHADRIFVDRLQFDLKCNEIDVWRDVKDIIPGDSISRSIEGALEISTHFLIVLSKHSVDSNWVDSEYRAALQINTSKNQNNLRIIPCILDKCEIPLLLRDTAYVNFSDYTSGINALFTAFGIEFGIHKDTFYSRLESLVQKVQATRKAQSKLLSGWITPSEELFFTWSPIEDELISLINNQPVLPKRNKHLQISNWQISNGHLDTVTEAAVPFQAYLASVIDEVLNLADRYGIKYSKEL